jgi:hypothetical protein
MKRTYDAKWAKIGNSFGYRFQSEFFKEHPGFSECGALVQVIDEDMVLLRRIKPEQEEQKADELMLAAFLNFAFKQGLEKGDFTQDSVEDMELDDELMDGVILDAD